MIAEISGVRKLVASTASSKGRTGGQMELRLCWRHPEVGISEAPREP